MTSCNYGEIPNYPEFKELFSDAFGVDEKYTITNHHKHAGEYTTLQLYSLLIKLRAEWENGNEEAGSFCSSIMGILGVEWI